MNAFLCGIQDSKTTWSLDLICQMKVNQKNYCIIYFNIKTSGRNVSRFELVFRTFFVTWHSNNKINSVSSVRQVLNRWIDGNKIPLIPPYSFFVNFYPCLTRASIETLTGFPNLVFHGVTFWPWGQTQALVYWYFKNLALRIGSLASYNRIKTYPFYHILYQ